MLLTCLVNTTSVNWKNAHAQGTLGSIEEKVSKSKTKICDAAHKIEKTTDFTAMYGIIYKYNDTRCQEKNSSLIFYSRYRGCVDNENYSNTFKTYKSAKLTSVFICKTVHGRKHTVQCLLAGPLCLRNTFQHFQPLDDK